MAMWHDYQDYMQHDTGNVQGMLRVLPQVYSPHLDNHRDVVVYLPPSYHQDETRRYPVLYMQDGQNLFDEHTSFSGEWYADETLNALAQEGIEAIVVALPSTESRLDEYSPFHDPKHGGGRGDAYLALITETIKPIVDADFRTRTERTCTGILGSSMGGLISLYAYFRRPEVFGFAGALSPALWFADYAIFNYVRGLEQVPHGRIYLDAGTQELCCSEDASEKSRRYLESVRQMRDLLRDPISLQYVEAHDAGHREQEWARRLPEALRFLLMPCVM
ncbi:MAG: alpha/beta hydrolase-fold protein [Anaerolineae bacterium]|jgi:predicted alpha/beta superfamily hydrolase|nr:alpha/beta hydrolase-fold protein [Anaerolineae bacterium]